MHLFIYKLVVQSSYKEDRFQPCYENYYYKLEEAEAAKKQILQEEGSPDWRLKAEVTMVGVEGSEELMDELDELRTFKEQFE
jgi:hypothetical protein